MSEPTREELEQQAAALGIPDPAELPNKEALEDAIDKATPNPALVPDPPPPPGEQTYKVVGPREVLGHTRDDTFTATLTAEHEASLVEAGHIQLIDEED
jgi:hypothetical protein